MNIPRDNAFTINPLGGHFFPLCCNRSQKEKVTRAFLCALRVIDICDIIEKNSKENLVLFHAEYNNAEYDGERYLSLTLGRIAHDAGVRFSSIASDTIVMGKGELKALLLDLAHYNLWFFDIGEKWDKGEVTAQVLTCLDYLRSEEHILPKLPSSQFFARSHDDCYLTIETYDPSFIKQVFSRMLLIYTGTILGEINDDNNDIPDIQDDILAQFWEENFNLSIFRELTQIENQVVRIGIANKAFSFTVATEYEAESWLHYDISTRQWLFLKPS